ncbi:hypothetical protein [Crocosphaera sp.]|uniref:hypothetical protein n=1 Tax=Crocosphaera sp. TaxID=2729996 RepID=UPI003F27A029|nr:hypothetical protein [Crocosphaera sp.]
MLFSLEYNIANLSRPLDPIYGHFRLGYDRIYGQFRLGQRFFNLACYINPQLSEQCLSQLAKKVSPEQERIIKYENQTPIFAFNYTRYGLNRKWNLLTWGFLVILAIVGTTFWFVNPIYFL